jgi:hypothetical protein
MSTRDMSVQKEYSGHTSNRLEELQFIPKNHDGNKNVAVDGWGQKTIKPRVAVRVRPDPSADTYRDLDLSVVPRR